MSPARPSSRIGATARARPPSARPRAIPLPRRLSRTRRHLADRGVLCLGIWGSRRCCPLKVRSGCRERRREGRRGSEDRREVGSRRESGGGPNAGRARSGCRGRGRGRSRSRSLEAFLLRVHVHYMTLALALRGSHRLLRTLWRMSRGLGLLESRRATGSGVVFAEVATHVGGDAECL